MLDLSQEGFKGRVLYNEPLYRHLTMRVGGPAALFCEPCSDADLAIALRALIGAGISRAVIGGGSNLLVADEGYDGAIIHIGPAMAAMEIDGHVMKAGAGLALARAVALAAGNGLSGLEFAVGIFGTVGGAVVMNAGTPHGDICSLVRAVGMVMEDGRPQRAERGSFSFGYRRCSLQQAGGIITSVEMELIPDDIAAIQERMKRLHEVRSLAQPHGFPSSGSIFKNPPGDSAGRLIEQAGLKGFAIGGAVVSDRHANFIINRGGASAADVMALMEKMSRQVRDRFGVTLEPEVKILS